MIFDIVDALVSLRPGAEWVMRDSELTWLDTKQKQPSKKEIDVEIKRLQSAYDALEYQRKRIVEYPPITDYLDAVVKGDQQQMQSYIDACLAVKLKYPKPEKE